MKLVSHSLRALFVHTSILQLLRSNDAKIQKVALKCIFGYKQKSLAPHRESFEKLVDDKSFRDELVRFSVDEVNSEINEENRADIMRVLMKLLDGKLHAKDTRSNRHAAIFRFIAGCLPHEIDMFLKTIFWRFGNILCEFKMLLCISFVHNWCFQLVKESKKRANAS